MKIILMFFCMLLLSGCMINEFFPQSSPSQYTPQQTVQREYYQIPGIRGKTSMVCNQQSSDIVEIYIPSLGKQNFAKYMPGNRLRTNQCLIIPAVYRPVTWFFRRNDGTLQKREIEQVGTMTPMFGAPVTLDCF